MKTDARLARSRSRWRRLSRRAATTACTVGGSARPELAAPSCRARRTIPVVSTMKNGFPPGPVRDLGGLGVADAAAGRLPDQLERLVVGERIQAQRDGVRDARSPRGPFLQAAPAGRARS